MLKAVYTFIGVFIISTASYVIAGEGDWKIFPMDNSKQHIPNYKPTIEKHFTVEGDTITGHCGLGNEIYVKNNCKFWAGAGPIWATNKTWPVDIKDFEMTCEFLWYFKSKPIKRVGDDPDMNIQWRLRPSKEGAYSKGGYSLDWGWLQQVRLRRFGEGAHRIGEGYQKRVKKNHIKLRIRVAGPIIKVKTWAAADTEPNAWTMEAYDDWSGTEFESGSIAIGFTSRKFFDTTAYVYKNIVIKELSEEEVSKEVFYDPKTAPAKRKVPNHHIKLPKKKISLKGEAALAGFTADENLIVKASDEGIILESKDGKPAYLWYGKVSGGQAKYRAIRVKASADARPLFGRRVTTAGKTDIGYFDPNFKKGVAGVFKNNTEHTANVSRAEWKPDTWFDMNYWRGHWCAWQLGESDKPETGIRFRATPLRFTHRKSVEIFGIGVVGKGTVTAQAFFRN